MNTSALIGTARRVITILLVAAAVPAAVTATASADTILDAPHFVLSVKGTPIASFGELSAVTGQTQPALSFSPDGQIQHTKQYGQTHPPTITLTRGVGISNALWQWHIAALAGQPTARTDATITVYDAGGHALMTYLLYNAWPTKLEIAGLKAGTDIVHESVTLTCDSIQTVA